MIKEGNMKFQIVMDKELRAKLVELAKDNGFKKTNDYINFILFQHVKSLEDNNNENN